MGCRLDRKNYGQTCNHRFSPDANAQNYLVTTNHKNRFLLASLRGFEDRR